MNNMVNREKIEKFHNEHPKSFVCYRYIKGFCLIDGHLKNCYILIYDNYETEYIKLYIVNIDKTIVELELKDVYLNKLFNYLCDNTEHYNMGQTQFTNRLVRDTNSDFKKFIKTY